MSSKPSIPRRDSHTATTTDRSRNGSLSSHADMAVDDSSMLPPAVQRFLGNYRRRLSNVAVDRLEASPGVAFDGKPCLTDAFIPPMLQPSPPARLTPSRPCVILGPAGSGKSHLAARLLYWHSQSGPDNGHRDLQTLGKLIEGFNLVLHFDCASAVRVSSHLFNGNDNCCEVEQLLRLSLRGLSTGYGEEDDPEALDIAAAVSWARNNPDRVLAIVDCADAVQLPAAWVKSCFSATWRPAVLAFARRNSQLPSCVSNPVLYHLLLWNDAQMSRYISIAAKSALPDSEAELQGHFLSAVDEVVKNCNSANGFLNLPGNLALLVTLYHLDPARFVSGPAPRSTTCLYDRLFHCLFAEAPSAAAAAAEAVNCDDGDDVVVGAAEAAADFADLNLVVSGARLAAFLTAKRLCLRCLKAASEAQLGNDAASVAVMDSLTDVWRRAIGDDSESDVAATDAVGPTGTARTVLIDIAELLGSMADDWLLESASRLSEIVSKTERERCQSLWHILSGQRHCRLQKQSRTHWLAGWTEITNVELTSSVEHSSKSLTEQSMDVTPKSHRLSTICLDFETLQCHIGVEELPSTENGRLSIDNERSSDEDYAREACRNTTVSSFDNLAAALEPWRRHGNLAPLDCLAVRLGSGEISINATATSGLEVLNKIDRLSELRVHCSTKLASKSAVAAAVVRAAERNANQLRRLCLSGRWLLLLGSDCSANGLARALARLPNVCCFGLDGDSTQPLMLTSDNLASLIKFISSTAWHQRLLQLDIHLDGFSYQADENYCDYDGREHRSIHEPTSSVAARLLTALTPTLPALCRLRFRCCSLTTEAVDAELSAGVICIADLLDSGCLERLTSFGIIVTGESRQGDCLQQACLLLLICERLTSFGFACGTLGAAADADAVADDASHVALLIQAALCAPDCLQQVHLQLGDVPEGRIRWLARWLSTATITPAIFRSSDRRRGIPCSRKRLRIGGRVTGVGAMKAAEALKQQLLRRGFLSNGCVELDLR